MGASANQGKSLNATNNSSSPSRSQNPCRETLVTSASEVLLPSCAYVMFVLLNKRLRLPQCLAAQADVLRKRDLRLHLELGFSLRMVDMHMQARLFTREEKEAKPMRAENGRCHVFMITPGNHPAEPLRVRALRQCFFRGDESPHSK